MYIHCVLLSYAYTIFHRPCPVFFGKCDKILINSTIGLDYNADEFNIFKLRLLKGCLLILTSIILLIFTLCGIAKIFIWVGIPILIVEEILTYTWAKK